jgi:hypothetical protein
MNCTGTSVSLESWLILLFFCPSGAHEGPRIMREPDNKCFSNLPCACLGITCPHIKQVSSLWTVTKSASPACCLARQEQSLILRQDSRILSCENKAINLIISSYSPVLTALSSLPPSVTLQAPSHAPVYISLELYQLFY